MQRKAQGRHTGENRNDDNAGDHGLGCHPMRRISLARETFNVGIGGGQISGNMGGVAQSLCRSAMGDVEQWHRAAGRVDGVGNRGVRCLR